MWDIAHLYTTLLSRILEKWCQTCKKIYVYSGTVAKMMALFNVCCRVRNCNWVYLALLGEEYLITIKPKHRIAGILPNRRNGQNTFSLSSSLVLCTVLFFFFFNLQHLAFFLTYFMQALSKCQEKMTAAHPAGIIVVCNTKGKETISLPSFLYQITWKGCDWPYLGQYLCIRPINVNRGL